MKNLSLKNRLSPTVVGLLCGAALAALPSIASAQLAESWENGVVAGKWVTSSGTNSYIVPDAANPPVLRSSITENEPECAGRYLRETIAFSGGRTWSAGAQGVTAVTAGQQYCVSAWIRAAAGSRPYLAIHYTNNAGIPVGAFGTQECFIAGQTQFTPPATCANLTQAVIPTNGTWGWHARSFTAQPASGATHIVAKAVNFCGNDGNCIGQPTPLPPVDFDDIRITAGACPATPPANTAPHTACTGATPVCAPGDAANNARCAACTGNAGAAAPAIACPADRPVCQTAGAEKGSCKTSCTSDFGGDGGAGACPETAPFCTLIAGSTTLKECKPCAGNNGSATMPACPAVNPTCFTTGAKAGACGKCTSNAECGGATPRCDVGTGRCTDDCEQDADCGDKKSGKICLASTLKCTDGCRGDAAGNGCPDGQKCTSVDLKPGTCEPTNPVPDAGPTPTPEPTTPTPTPTPTGEPTPTPSTPAEEEGGCSMSSGSVAGGTATMLVGLGVVVAAMGRRRRRD